MKPEMVETTQEPLTELWEKAPLAANPYQTAVWPGINSSQTLWAFEETQRFAVD